MIQIHIDWETFIQDTSWSTSAKLVDTSFIKKSYLYTMKSFTMKMPWNYHELVFMATKVGFWKFMGFDFAMKKNHFKNGKGKSFWAALILDVTLALISKRQSSVWTNHKHRVWKLSLSQTPKFDTCFQTFLSLSGAISCEFLKKLTFSMFSIYSTLNSFWQGVRKPRSDHPVMFLWNAGQR